MASLRYLWVNRVKFSLRSIKFYRAWGKRFFTFPEVVRRNNRRNRLIRKGAQIHETAEIGKLIVEGEAKKIKIGALSFIGRSYIALHAPVTIGDRVCINDDVKILTASHDVEDPKWSHTKGEIVVEDFAWISTGAMLLPGVKIGKGAVVGAGAVVSKSVPAGAIVVGNPAKPTQRVRGKQLDYNPCEFLAGNRAWLKG